MPSLKAIDAELARRDFHYFLEWSRPTWNWDWPHIRLMAERVQQTMDGDAPPWLLAEIGPQYGKTQLMTVGLTVWLLHRYPGIRIAIGSFSQDSANRMSLDARRLAQEVGLRLDKERSAIQEWMVEGGGRVRVVGRGGTLTGYPVDVMILDDLLKDGQEAESALIRDGVRDWISSVVMTRNPQYGFATGTPWHHEGPQTYLRENYGDILHELVLPSFAGENDPLGRAEGELLCEARWPRAKLERERKANPYRFEALYQCNPTPREGSLFKVSMLRFVEAHEVPVGLPTVRVWDLAATSGGGDYTAGVKMAGPDAEGTFYVVDVVRGQWDATERNRIIRATAEQDGPLVRIGIPQDPGAAGKEVVAAMRRLLAGFAVFDETETGSKELRAEPLAAQVGGGSVAVVRSHWTSDLVEEFRTFPLGKNDDQIDAEARAFNYLARKVEVYFA